MRRSHRSGALAFESRLKSVENFLSGFTNLETCFASTADPLSGGLLSRLEQEWNARQSNRHCRAPPKADLGSVTFFAGLDLGTRVVEAPGCDGLEGDVCGPSVNLNCCFFLFRERRLVAFRSRLFPCRQADGGSKEVFNEEFSVVADH